MFFLVNIPKIIKSYKQTLVYYKNKTRIEVYTKSDKYLCVRRFNLAHDAMVFSDFVDLLNHSFKIKSSVELIVTYDDFNKEKYQFNYIKQLAKVVIKRWRKFVKKRKVFRKLLKPVAEHLGNPRFMDFKI
jgi:hypothetical protein